MCHEHVIADTGRLFAEPEDPADYELIDRPVTPDVYHWIQLHPSGNRDNLAITDEDTAVAELSDFVRAGGHSLVDCTLRDIGRDPAALRRVSERSGVHIVMGSGYYVHRSHAPRLDAMSENDVAQELIEEVRVGVDGTGIRAGIIGEIGCSHPRSPREGKVLRGAAIAQSELGCAMSIHPGQHPEEPAAILGELVAAGAAVERVVMGHIDRTIQEMDGLKRLAASGCFIELDLFGRHVTPVILRRNAVTVLSDAQRIELLIGLLGAGHADQILVSQDICHKYHLRRNGGHGYAHFLKNIVPWLRERGASETQLQAILVDNPRRALTIA